MDISPPLLYNHPKRRVFRPKGPGDTSQRRQVSLIVEIEERQECHCYNGIWKNYEIVIKDLGVCEIENHVC